jgi:hypothetical protein
MGTSLNPAVDHGAVLNGPTATTPGQVESSNAGFWNPVGGEVPGNPNQELSVEVMEYDPSS